MVVAARRFFAVYRRTSYRATRARVLRRLRVHTKRVRLRTDACLGDEPKDNASLEQPAPVYSDTAFTTGRRSSIRSVSLYFLSLL